MNTGSVTYLVTLASCVTLLLSLNFLVNAIGGKNLQPLGLLPGLRVTHVECLVYKQRSVSVVIAITHRKGWLGTAMQAEFLW